LTEALLTLEDGTTFKGNSIGSEGTSIGEVVFNTAMTGYQEILTDPSYYKQIVTLTYPHIGNTGTNSEDYESKKTYLSGLVIRESSSIASNWRNENDLQNFLQKHSVVAIADIDTRKLTNHLRKHGSMKGCISTDYKDVKKCINLAKSFSGLSGLDLAKEVSVQKSYLFNPKSKKTGEPKYKVVAMDFGIKTNILNLLTDSNCEVIVVPAISTAQEIEDLNPDGVFLSNGPGDPEPCLYAIKTIQEILRNKVPVFGICLGHQLLALAAGAKTKKMKFGHHGANHPVQDLKTKEVFITSQNHGFTVDENNLPEEISITHRSLFDDSIQGISIRNTNAFSFQGHPEASPGPHDINSLFVKFSNLMKDA
jgi:carbamoyl-phosphate synthase small subunit